ncbi:MAG: ribose-5-phosphate isomerase RpiA [Chloroflexi bacterium]|nr:ribose-5-phosphate isomerase RpiA [Chloroflexota bacterium]
MAVESSAGDPRAEQRRAAAERAVELVCDGMVLGFGTGRAAGHALEALAQRMPQGLRVQGVPSSSATEARARALGLPLTTLDEHPRLDLTIDGADEVDPQRRLLKGGGGALLREKVLAAASDRLVIVVERAKLVPRLGTTRGVPVEVLPFAWAACARLIRRIGGTPVLRRGTGGTPSVTDNANWVLDCEFPGTDLLDPASLDARLRAIPGILETGLFWSFDATVVVGEPTGVRTWGPE